MLRLTLFYRSEGAPQWARYCYRLMKPIEIAPLPWANSSELVSTFPRQDHWAARWPQARRRRDRERVVERGVSVDFGLQSPGGCPKHRHEQVQVVVGLDSVEAVLGWQ